MFVLVNISFLRNSVRPFRTVERDISHDIGLQRMVSPKLFDIKQVAERPKFSVLTFATHKVCFSFFIDGGVKKAVNRQTFFVTSFILVC